jgi:hypothetical protein
LILEAQIIFYMDSKVEELELQASYHKLNYAKIKIINKKPNICDGIQNKRNSQNKPSVTLSEGLRVETLRGRERRREATLGSGASSPSHLNRFSLHML